MAPDLDTNIDEGVEWKETQFSFVYFNFAIIFACCIFWGLFLWGLTREKRRTIRYYHDTISSYCASSESWENRFLLTFTILIAMNLLCMYTEEYNSRRQESRYLWLFFLECSAAASFPFVGICYTEDIAYVVHCAGKYIARYAFERKMSHGSMRKEQEISGQIEALCDPQYIRLKNCQMTEEESVGAIYVQKENTDLDCGRCKIPIWYSTMVHSFAALYFLFVLSFCNLYYLYQIWFYHDHRQGVFICLGLGIFNAITMPVFITVQGMIYLRCDCCCKMKVLRMISFVFEALSGLAVITFAVVGSMRRNDDISWFD